MAEPTLSDSPSAPDAPRDVLQAPAISLPKGGGAIRGIGEKFAANPVTGTGSTTVPIATSRGRSGFGPELTLSYDSGSGNGPFGVGWSLSLPRITRKTDQGLPRYHDADESDVFILSGAEDLVPELARGAGGGWERTPAVPRTASTVQYDVERYRPRVEGLFARIERWTNRKTGESHWRSITRDNVTTLYGKDNNSRVFDPGDPDPLHPRRIFCWLISETYDDKGNAILYEYAQENGRGVDTSLPHERNRDEGGRGANRFVKRIRYGNRVSRLADAALANAGWMFEVVFDYGDHAGDNPTPLGTLDWLCRHDPFSSYRAGFEVRTYRLCQRVLMFHHFPGEPGVGADCLVRSADFAYRNSRNNADDARKGNPRGSFIASITQSGYTRKLGGGYLKRSLPPVEFEYTEAVVHREVRDVDAASIEDLPAGLEPAAQWVDLDGEGLSGILETRRHAWFYKRNLSALPIPGADGRPAVGVRFGPLTALATAPLPSSAGRGLQFMDLAGDGQLDAVHFGAPLAGFSERTPDGGWDPFQAFESLPNVDWNDPNLRFLDLTGDGRADLVLTENEAITWHPSLGERGFGSAERAARALDEETGPCVVFADSAQSVYMADLSGDGLADIVRIRNGEVCYWPNLGYGCFGAKVTMDRAPWFDEPDRFDGKRMQLADIDGSGTTDIVYLAADGVRLYFNECGNRWSEPHTVSPFPQVDRLSSIAIVDLLGNGTACLVWSSPLPGAAGRPMRYIDLIGGQKPHLLTRVVNNMGAETRVRYAPSTQFYLADKAAGRPWVTRLPFPVHVVERVETRDAVSRNRFVTRYAYHHGYFDGAEREFRGFGCVEQWDTEEFGSFTSEGDLSADSNADVASHVPPVRTVTWFHTGAYLEGQAISLHFAHEYHGAPKDADPDFETKWNAFSDRLLPDTIPPDGVLLADGSRLPRPVATGELREACRALKGSVLRQEVYAEDGSSRAGHPYTVSERDYTIEMLQPQEAGNARAVFVAHPRESIDYQCERLPDDPRISHALTLAVDGFGNVLRSVAIAYPRAAVSQRTPEQADTHVTLTLNRFANRADDADGYRAGIPIETRTYEVVKPPDGSTRFSFADVRTLVDLLVPPGGYEGWPPRRLRTKRGTGERDGFPPLAPPPP